MGELRWAGNLESNKLILGELLCVTHRYMYTHICEQIFIIFKYVLGTYFVAFTGTQW